MAGRCYSASTLDASRQHYVRGSAYCTRHAQLITVLERCSREMPQEGQETVKESVRTSVNVQGTVRAMKTKPEILRPESAASAVPSPPFELDRWPGPSEGELTIEAIDTSEWIASPGAELFRVKGWQVDCIDDFARHKLNNYTGNVSRRKVRRCVLAQPMLGTFSVGTRMLRTGVPQATRALLLWPVHQRRGRWLRHARRDPTVGGDRASRTCRAAQHGRDLALGRA